MGVGWGGLTPASNFSIKMPELGWRGGQPNSGNALISGTFGIETPPLVANFSKQ